VAPRARDTRADAERSFEQLYRGHRGDVYRAALRELGNVHDAEDVTQAAFVDAYRAVLRGTRPQAPRAWLLTIAENVRRRRFRTAVRRPREEPLDADAALAAEESHEQVGALVDALATLPIEQRSAFLLREISGLSYDEIAERTDSTVGSVQMLLFRARKTLRDQLEPPQVHGAFLPLATLLQRTEALSFAPRAAGAIGAAALAVGVSASVPAQADPPTAKPAAPQLVAAAPVTPRVGPAPMSRAPAATPAPARLRAPAAVPPTRIPQPVRRRTPPTPAAQPKPAQPKAPAPAAEPARATPPALSLATPVVSTPSIPLPPLLDPVLFEPVVEPLLEGAGAAGAAGAGAPPLPVLPLDSLPPVLP
jgi:RNA polymerase sigma-70 factor (ECF subfamily)